MIFRSWGLIVVHIPRTGGTSLEVQLLGRHPKTLSRPDYEHLSGWCPDRQIWLQHATPQQMLDLDLVSTEEFRTLHKVAVVRNPYDRALSVYLFLRNRLGPGRVTFADMLTSSGPWSRLLEDRSSPRWRGDHVRSQAEYCGGNGTPTVDSILRFESLQEDWADFQRRHELSFADLPRTNVGRRRVGHYSHFYSDRDVALVRERYADDLRTLDYRFEDFRPSQPKSSFVRWRVRSQVWLDQVGRRIVRAR